MSLAQDFVYLQSVKTVSCFQNHWEPLYQDCFLTCQLGSDVRPSSVQKGSFPNLCINRMVLGSHPGAVSPGHCQLFLMLTSWPVLSVPQISFQLSGLLLFLIKGKLISKIFLDPKASEYSLNVYFLDFNSLRQMIAHLGLCLDSDLTRYLFTVVVDFRINLLNIARSQHSSVWPI